MNPQEKVLAAFLEAELPDFDISRKEDKQMLILLSESVTLEQQVQDKDGNYRTVTITQDSDGKISAHSIKLSNVFSADLSKQLKLLSKAMGIFPVAMLLKFTGGFLAVLAVFLPMMKMEFNEQDAKVLLAIYKLHQNEFLVSEVQSQLQALDFEPITDKKMNASLVKFANAKVIRSLGHGKYLRKEKIKYAK
ncbi:MAG TPA: hypothetical protein ENK91_12670 [Bacteroidetes bacterium]|nr:hypothetical protein [Bacteroidota bacterium]